MIQQLSFINNRVLDPPEYISYSIKYKHSVASGLHHVISGAGDSVSQKMSRNPYRVYFYTFSLSLLYLQVTLLK